MKIIFDKFWCKTKAHAISNGKHAFFVHLNSSEWFFVKTNFKMQDLTPSTSREVRASGNQADLTPSTSREVRASGNQRDSSNHLSCDVIRRVGPFSLYSSDIASLDPGCRLTDAIIDSWLLLTLNQRKEKHIRCKILESTFPVMLELSLIHIWRCRRRG